MLSGIKRAHVLREFLLYTQAESRNKQANDKKTSAKQDTNITKALEHLDSIRNRVRDMQVKGFCGRAVMIRLIDWVKSGSFVINLHQMAVFFVVNV